MAYIRLELVAVMASSLAKFLTSVMVVHEMNGLLYLTLAAQMVASITLDYLLGGYLLLGSRAGSDPKPQNPKVRVFGKF